MGRYPDLNHAFGAPDRQVREELRLELRRIHDALGTTTLFVTHDEEGAMELADRAVMLERGRVVGERAGYGQPAPGASQASESACGVPRPQVLQSRIVEA